MQTTQEKSFDELVVEFLGTRLPRQLTEGISLSESPPDARNFIIRMLTLMKRSGYSAFEFTPALTRWMSSVPSFLPNAWGGLIPPITLPGRHAKLDAYVVEQSRTSGKAPSIFVDLGCGFPPVTTADTARKLADWQVFGVDRSFADYVLYDAEGHYACFDQKGVFQYFQSFMTNTGRALYTAPDAARERFGKLFADLFPLLRNSDDTKSEAVEKNGNRLIHNHIRDFETDNLTFVKSDFGELGVRSAKVIRCMNVLLYFKPEIQKTMLAQVGKLLDDDGILIAGTNGLGGQSRYAVYKKDADGLFPDEFAFGLDNLGHIAFMPWFTIHDNDPETMLLADLAGTIRADRSFRTDLGNCQDELLRRGDICERKTDGYLHFSREISPAEFMKKNIMMWQQMDEEGYVDRAVEVLERAGHKAWRNSVGDIAVRPPADSLPLCLWNRAF